MFHRYDGAAITAALSAVPKGWDYFQDAVFTGAARADQGYAAGVTIEDAPQEWAESHANKVIGKAFFEEEIDKKALNEREKGLPRSNDGRIKRVLKVILLEAWGEVMKDYTWERQELRPLGEITDAVATRCGIGLPDDFGDMAALERDRAKGLL